MAVIRKLAKDLQSSCYKVSHKKKDSTNDRFEFNFLLICDLW